MDHRGSDNGWERWRGSVDSQLDDQEAQLKGMWSWRVTHEEMANEAKQEIFGRISVLETKIAGLAAVGGILGGAAGAIAVALIQWLFK